MLVRVGRNRMEWLEGYETWEVRLDANKKMNVEAVTKQRKPLYRYIDTTTDCDSLPDRHG